jgi:hypothetical protein
LRCFREHAQREIQDQQEGDLNLKSPLTQFQGLLPLRYTCSSDIDFVPSRAIKTLIRGAGINPDR